jgi:hypothetical protein
MGTKYQIDETSCVRAKLNNSRLVSKIGTTTSGLLGCLNARKMKVIWQLQFRV